MDLIRTIFGLAVLTGPLWLIVVVLLVSIGVAMPVAKRFDSVGAKVVAGLTVFGVAFLVLFGDEIAGRMYFQHLCETEAGVKVYQTVELPAEYWDEKGDPIFYDEEKGNLRLSLDSIDRRSTVKKMPFAIEETIARMVNKNTETLLNERVIFRFRGGWLVRNFSLHNTASSCGTGLSEYTDFVRKSFVPK